MQIGDWLIVSVEKNKEEFRKTPHVILDQGVLSQRSVIKTPTLNVNFTAWVSLMDVLQWKELTVDKGFLQAVMLRAMLPGTTLEDLVRYAKVRSSSSLLTAQSYELRGWYSLETINNVAMVSWLYAQYNQKRVQIAMSSADTGAMRGFAM